jgi:hypothetical protein
MNRFCTSLILLVACIATSVLVGCEDEDSTNNEASVTTEELAGGTIKTTVREPITLLDGTTATQISIRVTHPDGATESSVSIDDGSLTAEPEGIYSRYSIWRTVADATPEGVTNVFLLRTTEFTDDDMDASKGEQMSNEHGTNDTPDGRWVVISDGVSNSLEIQTYP